MTNKPSAESRIILWTGMVFFCIDSNSWYLHCGKWLPALYYFFYRLWLRLPVKSLGYPVPGSGSPTLENTNQSYFFRVYSFYLIINLYNIIILTKKINLSGFYCNLSHCTTFEKYMYYNLLIFICTYNTPFELFAYCFKFLHLNQINQIYIQK